LILGKMTFYFTYTQETLPVGTSLDRYGAEKGGFLAPKGTPGDQRALAPGSIADGYRGYEVIKPLPIKSGQTAPAFGQSGGGVQYKIINPETGKAASVQWLLDNKYIRDVNK
jgi:filamentous hemagglutinin